MNIFCLSECPNESARWLVDKHVVKMLLESLQIMSTVADYLGLQGPYRPVMLNHPCTIWARESSENFSWLWQHAIAISETYTDRYGKRHKSAMSMMKHNDVWKEVIEILPKTGQTDFAVAISPNMRCRYLPGFEELSTVEKYRAYYVYDKDRIAVWSWPHEKPEWYGE